MRYRPVHRHQHEGIASRLDEMSQLLAVINNAQELRVVVRHIEDRRGNLATRAGRPEKDDLRLIGRCFQLRPIIASAHFRCRLRRSDDGRQENNQKLRNLTLNLDQLMRARHRGHCLVTRVKRF
jgi:hypothetical protein